MSCRERKETSARLADLLLDAQSAPAELRRHVAGCPECKAELDQLQATMALMDDWVAPDVNPYFDTKLLARLRSEQQAPPAGFLVRLRDRFVYGSSLRWQPLMAGALALVVLVGGGTYADLAWQAAQPRESATIRDLQSFDGNAQVLQQLDSIDQPGDSQNQDPGSSIGPSAND